MSADRTKNRMDTWLGYAGAVAITSVPIALAIAMPIPAGHMAVTAVLLIAIVASARLWGTGPALLAAGLSFVALLTAWPKLLVDLQPIALERWFEATVYLAVALFVAIEIGRLREERESAETDERAAFAILRISAMFVPDTSLHEVACTVAEVIRDLTGATSTAVIGPGEHRSPVVFASCVEDGASVRVDTRSALDYLWEHKVAIGLPMDAQEDRSVTYELPPSVPFSVATGSDAPRTDVIIPGLSSDRRVGGAIYVGPSSDGRPYPRVTLSRVVLVTRQLSMFGERQLLKSEAAHAQANSEAEQLRTSLMSSLSHELKTPIASMEATVSGLLDEGEPSPERVREELGALIVDLSRLNRSIGELLDLSRLESDEWRPTRDWHDLGDVVGSVVGALAARDRSRIVLDLPEEPVITYVDFVQVSRAVHHVVENALAYSAENERVVVSVGRSDTASFITVTDRGPGVPSTEQTRIFEKFYRGGSSSRVPHGTGLGLAISSEIMGRHGGTIRVEQARPQGARFVLEFPDGERPERGVVPLEEESV